MTDENVPRTETADQPEPAELAEAANKRTAQVAAIRDFAEWLDRNPTVPMPVLSLHRHLHSGDGTDAENLAAVRSIAASLAAGTDESLDDRTVFRARVNEHVYYELFAWHKGGRGDIGELEKLRAEVAELREAAAMGIDVAAVSDLITRDLEGAGLNFSREADDPTPVSPARVPLHTGGMTEQGLVDETAPVHLEVAQAKTMCGLAIIDLATGVGWTNDHSAITCKACIDGMPF